MSELQVKESRGRRVGTEHNSSGGEIHVTQTGLQALLAPERLTSQNSLPSLIKQANTCMQEKSLTKNKKHHYTSYRK